VTQPCYTNSDCSNVVCHIYHTIFNRKEAINHFLFENFRILIRYFGPASFLAVCLPLQGFDTDFSEFGGVCRAGLDTWNTGTV